MQIGRLRRPGEGRDLGVGPCDEVRLVDGRDSSDRRDVIFTIEIRVLAGQ